uniref:Uncharacterized protein n=1 Tax=Sphaerodactylus townsendi TaxID=933632 RepID=A0ACB8ELL0_9SAUR
MALVQKLRIWNGDWQAGPTGYCFAPGREGRAGLKAWAHKSPWLGTIRQSRPQPPPCSWPTRTEKAGEARASGSYLELSAPHPRLPGHKQKGRGLQRVGRHAQRSRDLAKAWVMSSHNTGGGEYTR